MAERQPRKRRARQKKQPKAERETFEVTVWDYEGNIVKKLWNATYEEAEEVREQYSDDPLKTVVVDTR